MPWLLSLGLTVHTDNILEVIFLLVWFCSHSGLLGNNAGYGGVFLLRHFYHWHSLSSIFLTSSLACFSRNYSPKSSISPGSPRNFKIRYLTSFIICLPRPWSSCLPLPPCASYLKVVVRQSPLVLDQYPNLPISQLFTKSNLLFSTQPFWGLAHLPHNKTHLLLPPLPQGPISTSLCSSCQHLPPWNCLLSSSDFGVLVLPI